MQSANLYQSLRPGEIMKRKIGTIYHLIAQEFVYVYKVEDFRHISRKYILPWSSLWPPSCLLKPRCLLGYYLTVLQGGGLRKIWREKTQ